MILRYFGENMFGIGKKNLKETEKSAEYLVYVIDDEEEIATIIETIICSKFSCDIKKFESADLALSALESAEILPDLIMSDVMMPGSSGFSLASILSEKNLDIPIIFVTALAGDDVHDGAYTVISKPFSKNQILDEVSVILK